MERTKRVFYAMLIYCMENENKNCLFFTQEDRVKVLYSYIPKSILDICNLHRQQNMISFPNGSKIYIKFPRTRLDDIRGYKIDMFEEFGLADYRVYQEMQIRKRNDDTK